MNPTIKMNRSWKVVMKNLRIGLLMKKMNLYLPPTRNATQFGQLTCILTSPPQSSKQLNTNASPPSTTAINNTRLLTGPSSSNTGTTQAIYMYIHSSQTHGLHY